MSLNQHPINRNFLNPVDYMFAITRLPGVIMNCQRVKMPDFTLAKIETPNPFNKLNFAASSADFGELEIEFKVDEDMKNYLEIFNWMKGLGFPDDFRQYKELKHNDDGTGGLRSDASLLIYTSEKNLNMEVVFRDVTPIALGNFVMSSRENLPNWVTVTAKFSIRDFDLHPANEPVSN